VAPRTPARRWTAARPVVPDDLDAVGLDALDDDAELVGVVLGPGTAAGIEADGLTLRRSRLSGLRLPGAGFRNLALVDVVVEDCDLAGVTFAASRFDRVVFRRCRMSGVVAADLVATDVCVDDTRADEIWLRAARLESCEITGCDLTGSDWYEARVAHSRITGCRLDGAELSSLALDDVVLHGSTFAGTSGLAGLRNATIDAGQLVELGRPVLAGLGIVVDADALAEDRPAAGDEAVADPDG
jgi:uncharacterized protein YjbI with pentapeptide repeats